MIWGRRKKAQAEADEALAAKIEADIELAAAHETKREVEAIDGASDIDPESALAKNNMRIVNAARSSLCMEHLQ